MLFKSSTLRCKQTTISDFLFFVILFFQEPTLPSSTVAFKKKNVAKQKLIKKRTEIYTRMIESKKKRREKLKCFVNNFLSETQK